LNLFRREKRAYPKIGLVPGSGSARGWAHIVVIQAKFLEFNREEEAIAKRHIKTNNQIRPFIEKGGRFAHP